MASRPRKQPKLKPKELTQIRMGPELKDRVNEYQRKLFDETGAKLSFSSAIRTLVELGLAASRFKAQR